MNHDTFTQMICLWLDNELSESEVVKLQTHLAGCQICQHTYQTMQRVDALLRGGAKVVAAPTPGFTMRFEARLVQRQAQNGGQVWLGFGVLLLGTLFLFIVGSVVIGALVNAGLNLFGVETVSSLLETTIRSANLLGVWLNLVALLVKASFITMSQPLFWGYTLVAGGLAWAWLRLLKSANRQLPTSVELLV